MNIFSLMLDFLAKSLVPLVPCSWGPSSLSTKRVGIYVDFVNFISMEEKKSTYLPLHGSKSNSS